MHAFWLTLIVPAALLIASRINRRAFWLFGTIASLVGLSVWAGLGVASADTQSATEVVQSGLHHIVRATDLPLVQLSIGFAAGWVRVRKRRPDPEA